MNGEWNPPEPVLISFTRIGVGVGIAIGIVFPLLATGNLDISLLITVGGLAGVLSIPIATPDPDSVSSRTTGSVLFLFPSYFPQGKVTGHASVKNNI